MTKKLCILIDPDKPQAYSVAKSCIEYKDLINDYGVEVWIGTSKTNFQTINYFTKILRDERISEIVVFPGRLDHAFCYKNAKRIFRPILLNCTKWYMHAYVKLGKLLTSFFDFISRDKKSEDYAYITLGSNSTVGKKLGSLPLEEEEIISIVKRYLKNLPKEKGIYFEAGSGSKKCVSPEVVIKSRKILPEKMEIIVGGGINSPEEVKKFFDSGANKVVVGTYFEDHPEKIEEFIGRLYS
ncbi:MAG: geranylgeranylglyceryl/heptaprenylglyceryl phosphate synthase [Candidatus Aenigmatarchaeota archaeon]